MTTRKLMERAARRREPVGIIIYGRKSNKVEFKRSLAEQDEACELLAAEKFPDLPIVARYYEEASAWAESNRPTFNKVLAHAAADNLVVITWTCDRFSREGADAVLPLLKADAPVRLVTVDGKDTANPAHRRIIIDTAENDREYSDKISANVCRAKDEDRKAGRWLGGKPPFGFVLDAARKCVFEPTTIKVRRRILEWALAGKPSTEIVALLNQSKTPSAEGAKWGTTHIGRILRHPINVGWMPDGNKGEHARDEKTGKPIVIAPALITVKQRAQLLAMIDARTVRDRNGKLHGRKGGDPHMLTSRIYCYCESPLVAGGPCYRCSRWINTRVGLSNSISGRHIELFAGNQAMLWLAFLDTDNPAFEVVKDAWLRFSAPDVIADLSQLDIRIAELTALMADLRAARYKRKEFVGSEAVAQYDAWMAEWTTELAEQVAERSHIEIPEPDLGDFDYSTMVAAWPTMTTLEQRSIVGMCIERLTVGPAASRGSRFDCNRVTTKFVDGLTVVGSVADYFTPS